MDDAAVKRRDGVFLAAGLLVLAGVALIPPVCRYPPWAGNQRSASATLRTFATAQADFLQNDLDGDGVKQYWRWDVAGLYQLRPKGSEDAIKLIERSAAIADDSPIAALEDPAAPKAGYWFRALRHADETPGSLSPNRFAACAFPADYPKSGRKVYIIDERNTLYSSPFDLVRIPAVFPDEATLRKNWSKLD